MDNWLATLVYGLCALLGAGIGFALLDVIGYFTSPPLTKEEEKAIEKLERTIDDDSD